MRLPIQTETQTKRMHERGSQKWKGKLIDYVLGQRKGSPEIL